jgi:hypothetical protein
VQVFAEIAGGGLHPCGSANVRTTKVARTH